MGKSLKKVEYNEEQEARFRGLLTQAQAKKEKPVYTPTLKDFAPAGYESKIVNDPNTFVCRLKSTDSNRINLEFVKHVFGKYRVPRLLDDAWYVPTKSTRGYRDRNLPPEKILKPIYPWREWWLCLASGGSLYKDHCKSFLTKKEVHTFITCPHEIMLSEAVVYSVAICYGATVGNALRIARSNLKDKRLDEDVSGKFWREVIQFFATNTPDTINDINDLMDYAWTKFNENLNFSVLGQGFTVTSLKRKMKDWHYELARVKVMGNDTWKAVDIPNFEVEVEDEHKAIHIWRVEQILTAKSLAAEGNAMHHCVYSYRSDCRSGQTSIWSMKSYNTKGIEKRRLTIELDNDTRTVVQARGYANRVPRPQEVTMLRNWAFKNNIEIRNYIY